MLATVLEEMPPFPERESSILAKLKKKKPAAARVIEENAAGPDESKRQSKTVPGKFPQFLKILFFAFLFFAYIFPDVLFFRFFFANLIRKKFRYFIKNVIFNQKTKLKKMQKS